MENSALIHLITTQTQLIQQLQQTQQQMQQQQMTTNSMLLSGQPAGMATSPIGTVGTPLNDVGISFDSVPNVTSSPNGMTTPDIYDGSMYYPNLNIAPPQIFDPTQYASYGAPDSFATQTTDIGNQNTLTPTGLFKETISEMREFDASRTSKEGTEAYFTQQTRGFQEQAVTAAGSLGGAAGFVGSFFIPGMLPAIAGGLAIGGGVSYVSDSMLDGARTALDYQDILQREGYRAFNAFESTTEFGGIGINLDDRQDLSKFIRDLAPEKFLEDQEMQQLLTGALDNKLLKSSSDAESFKKKFTEIVDTVKQITITMNQSIEEATAFMGEMERMGVTTKDMALVAGQTKVISSVLGIDASTGSQLVLGTTDSIVQGTSMDAGNALSSTAHSMFLGSLVESEAKSSGDPMYNYIKNNGGTGPLSASMEQQVRTFMTGQGRDYLLGFFGSAFEKNGDNFTVNRDILNNLLNGNYTVDEMERMASENVNRMSETDKAKLIGTASSVWNNAAGTSDNYAMLAKIQEIFSKQAGAPMDPQTALVQMGLTSNYEEADFLNRLISASQDPNAANQFSARSFKEQMDSAALAESPSVFRRMGFWWKRNVTNRFGDIGQGISDEVGDMAQDYQRMLTGMDDRSVVGGDLLAEYSLEGLNAVFNDGARNINEHLKRSTERLEDKVQSGNIQIGDVENLALMRKGQVSIGGNPDANTNGILSKGTFDVLIQRIESGSYTGADLRRLKERIANGDFDNDAADKLRAEYVVKKADGTYDGLGNFQQAIDRMGVTKTTLFEKFDSLDGLFTSSPDEFWSKVGSVFSGEGSVKTTKEALDADAKQLEKEGKGLNKKLSKLFSDEDLGVSSDEYDLLEGYIKLGKVDEVEGLTSNSAAIKLAKDYQTFLDSQHSHMQSRMSFSDMSRQTEGVARMGQQLADLFSASGEFSEDELHSLFGDYREEGKDLLKDIEKENLTPEEMREQSLLMLDQGREIFKGLTQERLERIARFAADQDASDHITMDNLLADGTNQVDADKLFDVLSNDVIRQVNAGEKKIKGDDSSIDTKKTADGHKKAMYELLDALKEETEAMREASTQIKTSSNSYYSSYSGLTSRK